MKKTEKEILMEKVTRLTEDQALNLLFFMAGMEIGETTDKHHAYRFVDRPNQAYTIEKQPPDNLDQD